MDVQVARQGITPLITPFPARLHHAVTLLLHGKHALITAGEIRVVKFVPAQGVSGGGEQGVEESVEGVEQERVVQLAPVGLIARGHTRRLDVEGTIKKIMTTEYIQEALKEAGKA